MRCEDVRPLLPGLGEAGMQAGDEVEEHVRTCPACSAELGRYRMVVQELSGLRDVVLEPPEGFLARLLEELPEVERRGVVRRVAADERFQHAVFSVGGAVVGATAVGLLWWRAARRALSGAPGGRASATL